MKWYGMYDQFAYNDHLSKCENVCNTHRTSTYNPVGHKITLIPIYAALSCANDDNLTLQGYGHENVWLLSKMMSKNAKGRVTSGRKLKKLPCSNRRKS